MTPESALAPARSAGGSRRPRLLAGLALLGCAAVYATGLVAADVAGVISVAGGLLWFVSYLLLRREVQHAADLPDEQLDEREILLRDRSYLSAYRLVGGALAVSLLLGIVDRAVDGPIVDRWLTLVAAMLLLSVVLPSVVLAVTTSTDGTDGTDGTDE